jgi:hypothetical protein
VSQFARPDADLTNQGFVNEVASGTNLYLSLDEVSADDADYAVSAVAPTSDVYVCSLSTIEDPVSSAGHVVRYRYKKSAAAGAGIDLTVQLRQGYVSEGAMGTLIASATHADISSTAVSSAINLSGAEADSITNYADLALRFVFNQV